MTFYFCFQKFSKFHSITSDDLNRQIRGKRGIAVLFFSEQPIRDEYLIFRGQSLFILKKNTYYLADFLFNNYLDFFLRGARRRSVL